jgi:hypothetical protein
MENMTKRYLVIGTWLDKATGQPKARLAEINEGISKEGRPFAFVETEKTQTADGVYEIATELKFNMTLAQPQGLKSIKL